MENTSEFLREEISNVAFYNVKNDDESIVASMVLDSITIIDLAVAIENKFGITISNKEINEENFDSVNKIASFIKEKKSK